MSDLTLIFNKNPLASTKWLLVFLGFQLTYQPHKILIKMVGINSEVQVKYKDQ